MAIPAEHVEYMKGLKGWLDSQEDTPLEEMGSFFGARISDYEEHMLEHWAFGYEYLAKLVPENAKHVLDLGCGTGLELDELFKLQPDVKITGIDLAPAMMEKLKGKHADKNLDLILGSYFDEPFPENVDAVISFESLHHFTAAEKLPLFKKIYEALAPGGVFMNGDYFACCDEEETLLRETCDRRRAKQGIPAEQFVHFDTPLTEEHEMQILRDAGFTEVYVDPTPEDSHIVIAKK